MEALDNTGGAPSVGFIFVICETLTLGLIGTAVFVPSFFITVCKMISRAESLAFIDEKAMLTARLFSFCQESTPEIPETSSQIYSRSTSLEWTPDTPRLRPVSRKGL